MPFTVQDLIQDNPRVITASPAQDIKTVLHIMVEHDYSQLPVIDAAGKPLGIITNDSILRAVNNLNVSLDKLRVSDALRERVSFFRQDADLFELLDTMRDSFAVLIVDGGGKLQGIVTSYDTTEYFRQRAEDMMLVEDIEALLKEYIQLAFTDKNREVNEEKLDKAVQRITVSSTTRQDNFKKALKQYLGSTQQGDEQFIFNETVADIVFTKHMDDKHPPKTFNDLTFYDYMQLFTDEKRWDRYQDAFSITREDVKQLLDEVRQIRNALAHFQGDLTDEQRDRLHFCSEWLGRYQSALNTLFLGNEDAIAEGDVLEEETDSTTDIDDMATINEEINPGESRYTPLAVWLQNQPPEKDVIRIHFTKIEDIIADKLPTSAYNHRSWWANDSYHVQAQQWLDAGWRVGEVGMGNQAVRFTRIKGREKAYIKFYSALLKDFRQTDVMPIKEISPRGQSYQHLYWIRANGPKALIWGAAFASDKRFRVELYIDTRDKVKNKAIFDEIFALKDEIEATLKTPLQWERIDNRIASRIAIYQHGTITDDEVLLAEYRKWLLQIMPQFYNALIQPAQNALQQVTGSIGE